VCKATLEMVLAKVGPGIRFNEQKGDGETVFPHACKPRPRRHSLEAEGFCLPVRPDWLKIKNADTPAVEREAEQDWAGDLLTAKVS
jgi:hypothetical protein